jgi:outer membrane receptor protein involved in Fe transport
LNVRGTDGLGNEGAWAFELGYTGKLTDQLTLRADGYYQRYTHLIGTRTVAELPLELVFDDTGEATGYGAEVELVWKPQPQGATVSAWYAYHRLDVDRNGQDDVRSFLPARHKVGVIARVPLPDDWTVNAMYRWTDVTKMSHDAIDDVGPTHRFDLALSKSFPKVGAELSIGVLDVLDEGHSPGAGFTPALGHDVPGRTVFGRVQIKF